MYELSFVLMIAVGFVCLFFLIISGISATKKTEPDIKIGPVVIFSIFSVILFSCAAYGSMNITHISCGISQSEEIISGNTTTITNTQDCYSSEIVDEGASYIFIGFAVISALLGIIFSWLIVARGVSE